jgi:hypothetical protein
MLQVISVSACISTGHQSLIGLGETGLNTGCRGGAVGNSNSVCCKSRLCGVRDLGGVTWWCATRRARGVVEDGSGGGGLVGEEGLDDSAGVLRSRAGKAEGNADGMAGVRGGGCRCGHFESLGHTGSTTADECLRRVLAFFDERGTRSLGDDERGDDERSEERCAKDLKSPSALLCLVSAICPPALLAAVSVASRRNRLRSR